MRKLITVGLSGIIAGPVLSGASLAADMKVTIEVPKLDVAEYHRPYVAAWIENADGGVAANLSVWYEFKKENHKGNKWLKDLRQWWRRAGRELDMPVDGLSSATRPVGKHPIDFSSSAPPLAELQPGEYELVVEAAREVGGRELVRIPFKWPAAEAFSGSAQGKDELGVVALEIKP
ncbi:MAG TPA: DUF2271 domain-containing protein [Hyphomicrobium sp.]|nr:DUF2271 domain-containing protein [Hyphomicrobium sp.]